jgi:hypothetical protein
MLWGPWALETSAAAVCKRQVLIVAITRTDGSQPRRAAALRFCVEHTDGFRVRSVARAGIVLHGGRLSRGKTGVGG